MNENTINANVTMDGASCTLLAGRYRVVRQLGQGGMGSVWLAEDTKLDGYRVAVKMLPSILFANKRAYEQLKAEALVSLKLTHPNIATVRAFEENGGNPFLVIDYIDGETLDDLLAEKGTLSEAETIKILSPVASALDYAHRHGVVHRDVKPGNVMIAKDGTPYVLDFGIAREIQETMTRVTGRLSSGTLLYMSPEQLSGAAPKPAQDVYSFAAMAYECLKGNAPFCRGQVEYQILNEEPEPLSGGSLTRSVMKGLSKDPAERPSDCNGILVSTRKASGGRFRRPQVEKPEARHLSLAACLAPFGGSAWARPLLTVVVTLVALIGVVCWRVSVSARVRRAAEAQKREGARVQQESEENQEIERRVREEQNRRQAEELTRQKEKARVREVEESRKIAVSGVQSNAAERLAGVRKLDGGDGIGGMVEGCNRQFRDAEKLFDAAQWRDAEQGYENVIETCVKIEAMAKRRNAARVVRSEMLAACGEARRAGAETYAKNMFALAEEFKAKGDESWREMLFGESEKPYREAAKRFAQAKQKSETAAERRANGTSDTAEVGTLQKELSRIAEREALLGRVIGTWISRYSHIVELSGSAPANLSFADTLQVNADGSYRLEIHDLTQSKIDVESGQWKFDGKILTLRQGRDPSKDEGVGYELSWTGKDRFGMQLTAFELGKRRMRRPGTVQCLSCYYDSTGVLHEKMSDSRFRNGEYTVRITPKWYERESFR